MTETALLLDEPCRTALRLSLAAHPDSRDRREAFCVGYLMGLGDREGHGTERPQASPQPRDEPPPSPNHTNPEAEHG